MALLAGLRPVLFAGLLAGSLLGGSIEGRVTNGATGEPVGGVEVRFIGLHSYVFQTVTDANGAYRLENLADGGYSGEFSKDGFQNSRGASSVQVAGGPASRLDAKLNPFGELRGRVVDEEGKPAARVHVELAGRGGGLTTDENGDFAMTGLFAGEYIVVAKPDPVTRIEGGVRMGTVPVYYPSVTKRGDAVPVQVDWGSAVAGIVIRLRSVPVQRIAGVVLGPDGKPAAKATVKLMGRAEGAGESVLSGMSLDNGQMVTAWMAFAGPPEPEVAQVETREDGSFEFAAVERGEWRLSAGANLLEDGPLAGVGSAVVGDGDVDAVRIGLSEPFAVPVVFDWSDAKPSDKWNGQVGSYVMLSGGESQPRMNIDPVTNVGRINGVFPGRYWVMTPPIANRVYVGAVMLDGMDVMGKEVEFGEGSGPLRLVMRQDMGTLRGTVENGEGSAVVLTRGGAGETQVYRMETAKANGAFEFDSVAPGDYFVVALAHAPERMPAAWTALAQRGTSVRVETGSAATVNLRVR